MTDLARKQFPVTDAAGNLVAGVSIEVREEAIGAALVDLFSDRTGASPLGNPFVSADGLVAFHAAGGPKKITATLGAFSQIWRYEPMGTAGEYDIEQLLPAMAQPLDADLTAIAALGTTSYGRALLELANQADLKALVDITGTNSGDAPDEPGGRLTLTSGTPVQLVDSSAATTIYYALKRGLHAPLYNGTITKMVSIVGELSLVLDASSGHTGYHQSGKNFDLFLYEDSGTVRLVSGPAWTSDTVPSATLAYKNGFLTNNASMTGRFGSASGNTVTCAANTALRVGTFRASADGQTAMVMNPAAAAGGGDCKLYLWNAFNRVDVAATSKDSTNSWTYALAAWRAANAAGTGSGLLNRVSAVFGLNEESVLVSYNGYGAAGSTGALAMIGIGVDATNALSGSPGSSIAASGTTNTMIGMQAVYSGLSGLGLHFFQAIESAVSVTNTTYYGDNNTPTTAQMALTFRSRM